MATVDDIANRLALTMTADPIPERSTAHDPAWKANHWRCTIARPGRGNVSMTVEYSMGEAHRRWKTIGPLDSFSFTAHDLQRFGYKPGERVSQLLVTVPRTIWVDEILKKYTEPTPPTLRDVLNCLASDAQGYDAAPDFESWADEYGLDTDSRKAEATYRTIGDQAKRLRHLLGDDAYRELLTAERL